MPKCDLLDRDEVRNALPRSVRRQRVVVGGVAEGSSQARHERRRHDAGIDLVAETTTGELHAIQAKFYDEDDTLNLKTFTTFLTAAGKKGYGHGLIFLTATKSTGHLRDALQGQKTPISLVTLHDLEARQIDWSKYQPGAKLVMKPQKHLRPHQQHALAAVTVSRWRMGSNGPATASMIGSFGLPRGSVTFSRT